MQTIMVVEDDLPIAFLLKAYLEKSGYRVVITADGEEALRQFFLTVPSLVLLDSMLPGRDGWMVLEEIRRQSSCPVIMITAGGAVQEPLKEPMGADDYVPKPFDPEDVVTKVRTVLKRSLN